MVGHKRRMLLDRLTEMELVHQSYRNLVGLTGFLFSWAHVYSPVTALAALGSLLKRANL